MRVILLNDVPKLGKKYDLKNVSDGYAHNFLIPRNLVELATSKGIKKLEERKKRAAAENKMHLELLEKSLKSLEVGTITIEEKANEQGHLFSKLHKEEVIAKVKELHNVDIKPEYLKMDEPIKEVGIHEIPIEAKGVRAKIKVEIKAVK